MSIYDLEVLDRKGNTVKMSDYKGKVLIIVNTATGCGFTPQYEGLQNMYNELHDKGLEILDFPCNQFGHQAPGTDVEIHEFCTAKYNATFPQFKKSDVNGDNANPVFEYIKKEAPYKGVKGLKNKMTMASVEKISGTGKSPYDIRWNFTKFIVDKNGKVVGRYEPIEEPSIMREQVEKLLNE